MDTGEDGEAREGDFTLEREAEGKREVVEEIAGEIAVREERGASSEGESIGGERGRVVLANELSACGLVTIPPSTD